MQVDVWPYPLHAPLDGALWEAGRHLLADLETRRADRGAEDNPEPLHCSAEPHHRRHRITDNPTDRSTPSGMGHTDNTRHRVGQYHRHTVCGIHAYHHPRTSGDEGIDTLGRRHIAVPYHSHGCRVGLVRYDDIAPTHPGPQGKLPPARLDMRGVISCIVANIESVIGTRRGTHIATYSIESPDTIGIKKSMKYILH